MLKVSKMVREADIRAVLQILSDGLSIKDRLEVLDKYFSLFLYLVENWIPDLGSKKVFITRYSEIYGDAGKSEFHFVGVDEFDGKSFYNVHIDLVNAVHENKEIIIPESLVKDFDKTRFVAIFFDALGKHWDAELDKSSNRGFIEDIANNHIKQEFTLELLKGALALHNSMVDGEQIKGAIKSASTCLGKPLKWKELIKGVSSPGEIKSMSMFFGFAIKDIPADSMRARECLSEIKDSISQVDFYSYKDVYENGEKIVIEENTSCPKLPFIYVKDKCEKKFSIHEFSMDEITAMDIYNLVPTIKNPAHIAGLVILYYLYPIRVERVQKKFLRMALTEQLKASKSIIDK